MKKQLYTEEELDRFVFFPEAYSAEERAAIERFIEENALAAEFVGKTRKLKDDLSARLRQEPSESDREFAKRIFGSKQILLPSFGLVKNDSQEIFAHYSEIIEKRTLPQRFTRFIRVYPLRSASVVALVAAALVILVTLRKPVIDYNPAYAEVKDNVLAVYNKGGEKLWTKPAAGTPDYTQSTGSNNRYRRPFLIADVDGDGTNEVITDLYNETMEMTTNSLTCYSDNGIERWKYTPTFKLEGIGSTSATATRSVIFDFTLFAASKSETPKLYVVVCDPTFSPSCIIQVDPKTLSEEQRYWHTGGINKIFVHDVNNDGKPELLIAGINDAVDMVFFAGIDPENGIEGKSSTMSEQLQSMPSIQEMFYCVLPPVEFYEKLSVTKFNTLWTLQPLSYGENVIDVETNEIPYNIYHNAEGGIHYIFDKTLTVRSVSASSNFEKIYNNYRESKDRSMEPLNQEYFQKLKKNVRWWDGNKFVNYPTYNKRYTGKQFLP